ncbi:TRAP transporter small permease [Aliiroseovarius crassostreae]|uniref:TRAP transporter small permease protein n=1 Tax=Aliiroseovarius crassostreae TaxID=154981 RepID=A0A9Q9LWD6_9RHOB|nr:TRAP transporter small permease [Aliiroseovarius crassostreae]UWP88103.1 TRAP transporter small permease [Aliiroseovarius crassostreae]UWP91257.1 TRAP transporter small permease [Aliiroseovarius crassostreae]UWP94442.1 TRAP transporter small permease [Aliiroseovarius crassostreae]UWP97567.1 TRAP transporter small permease [Aliiroseovarius crassostreae]
MSHSSTHKTGFEETAIAVLLGLMTMITFTNVVLRYVFNSSIIWGLEVVLILFAWLVLFGVSYGVKITAHLGVDALTNVLPTGVRKTVALIAAAVCIAYAFLLLKGAWDYWAPYAALDRTSGRWFPTGFEKTRDQAWYITDQVPMPDFLRFLEGWINQGEAYDKLPRVIPYAILPIGMALLLFRFLQATLRIWSGRQDSLIVSHEVEDEIDQLQHDDDDGDDAAQKPGT